MAVELELKLIAKEDVLQKIAKAFPGGNTISMETVYYDTPTGTLSQKRCTLRRRLENGVSVCALKTPMGATLRGEWEVKCHDIFAAIPLLCQAGAPSDLLTLTEEGIVPICGARFTRQAIPIEKTDFSAELALDTGVLTGGGREVPLCEVELEYKFGDTAAFLAFTETFVIDYNLQNQPLSKFRRALDLYRGEK